MGKAFDVIIVGGRVAGSTLAALLGAGGLNVLLLERTTFPSDTLSTHVIYGDSFGVWERIGAWSAIERLGNAKLWGISWIRDDKPDIRGGFGRSGDTTTPFASVDCSSTTCSSQMRPTRQA